MKEKDKELAQAERVSTPNDSALKTNLANYTKVASDVLKTKIDYPAWAAARRRRELFMRAYNGQEIPAHLLEIWDSTGKPSYANFPQELKDELVNWLYKHREIRLDWAFEQCSNESILAQYHCGLRILALVAEFHTINVETKEFARTAQKIQEELVAEHSRNADYYWQRFFERSDGMAR